MSDAESVRVGTTIDKAVRDTLKEKLDHGGISNEIRDHLTRVAFGEDLGQRSRIERRIELLQSDLRDTRKEIRELAAQEQTIEDEIQSLHSELSNLSTREDKYEARLEALEVRLRGEGARLFTKHSAVKHAASAIGVEPEGIIERLKERNPDVPAYAFEDGMLSRESWDGVEPERVDLPVDER